MHLITEPYLAQQSYWPTSGRHILAQYDDTSIVVYQAYRPAIGRFAAQQSSQYLFLFLICPDTQEAAVLLYFYTISMYILYTIH